MFFLKGCKLVERVLNHFHEYGVEKITLKNTLIQKDTVPCLFPLGMG